MTDAFFKGASPDNVRAFLQKFIRRIVVHPDKISIVYFPPKINAPQEATSLEGAYTVKMVPKRGVVGLKRG